MILDAIYLGIIHYIWVVKVVIITDLGQRQKSA